MPSPFHPIVTAWLARRFSAPTDAQARAWPLIAAGEDVVITAPTGSGKTLAAFAACLDRLVRDAVAGPLEDQTRVLYVSPLKALSNDIRVNLEEPLAQIAALAEEMGYARPVIRTAVRTGDTTARERRAAVKKPPHILVTTPESLYILLTSESGRRALRDVRTLIVDEIHALARDKRGAHLALSVERLEALCAPGRLQRIGLSATVNPIELAGRLLCGAARPAPHLVEVSLRRDLDLSIELPRDELGAVCTNEQWGEIYDRIAELVASHRSTLVFVNTRRLVERVAHRLGERLGEANVAAHHGSLSRERRHKAEARLKAGDLRVVVATASLELGIDVGVVDLVCLVGSPRSISTGLQRIGRSGHVVGGTPRGRLFPLTRDQLVETVALVRAARRGVIDAVALRDAPLDVLGQQIVAACACEEWDEDALFDLVRRAAPYANLARPDFDAMVDMLAEGIATSRGRAGALLHRDAVNRKLKGRRGARLAALTSGGAIPDNANYDVLLEPEGTLVGTIDEDFAVESMAGDIILLGNSSWRIRRVEAGRVRVEDAQGAPPTIPFWLGEGPARTRELSIEVGLVRQAIAAEGAAATAATTAAVAAPGVAAHLVSGALDDAAFGPRVQGLVRDYVRAGEAALGGVPSRELVIAERFFDEAGGMQLVLHAPFGGRINRAWGTALRKRFCRSFDFELQAAATDDGIVLSLGAQHSFPLETVFQMLRAEDVDELLTQASVQAPMFETRWRWNAMRALALLRFRGGKRVAPAIQRMRAQDLIAAVFPAQTACQDNHGGGAIEIPDHPLVRETIRDCLTEAMDSEGLRAVLTDLRAGRIKTLAREVPEPSVFAHEILNSNPYTFLDDAPLEERRTRAVTLRRGLPAEVVERLGTLDPARIDDVVAEAQPDARDPDELHDLLLDLGAAPEALIRARAFVTFAETLVAGRRAAWIEVTKNVTKNVTMADSGAGGLREADPRTGDDRAAREAAARDGDTARFLVAAERRALAETVWPGVTFQPDLAEPALRRPRAWSERDGALAELVRGHLALLGPTTVAALAARLHLSPSDVEGALARVELEGNVLRGRFDPRLELAAASAGTTEPPATQWCERRLLARINRRTLDGLRREIEPASAADYLRFLLAWQHVATGTEVEGRAGLLRVIEQLQGFEAAAGAWERDILPARVRRYDPAWLDGLCLSGDVTWGRLAAREAAAAPNRTATIALVRRRDLAWLLASREGLDDAQLSAPAREVVGYLREAGACFVDDLVHGARRLRSEVEDALWELVGAGRVTGDGFAGLRALVSATSSRGSTRGRWHARWVRRQSGVSAASGVGAGRWAVLRPPPTAMTEEETVEALARQYLRRYGVLIREVLAREPQAPPWRELLRVLRRLEMRGEIRGGRLVAGFVGEQFALPEALESLRALRRATENGQPRAGDVLRLSACDPLNLAGIITPGDRITASLGNQVVLRDGVPLVEARAPGEAHDSRVRPPAHRPPPPSSPDLAERA